jgi:hypothetical protein
MKKFTKLAVLLSTAMLGFGLASVGIATAGNKASVVSDLDPDRKLPVYERNESGQSTGSLADASIDQDAPDLIKALATNGAKGYVRSEDLIGPLPKSPEEAIREQKTRARQRVIPVYDSDGKTVIGSFVIGSQEPIRNP